jgi:hypothetical protein
MHNGSCDWWKPPDCGVMLFEQIAVPSAAGQQGEVYTQLSYLRRGHYRICFPAPVRSDTVLRHLYIEYRHSRIQPVQEEVCPVSDPRGGFRWRAWTTFNDAWGCGQVCVHAVWRSVYSCWFQISCGYDGGVIRHSRGNLRPTPRAARQADEINRRPHPWFHLSLRRAVYGALRGGISEQIADKKGDDPK